MCEHFIALHPRMNAKIGLASRKRDVRRTRVIVASKRRYHDGIATTLRFMRRRAPPVVDVWVLNGIKRYDTVAIELDADLVFGDADHAAGISVEHADARVCIFLKDNAVTDGDLATPRAKRNGMPALSRPSSAPIARLV